MDTLPAQDYTAVKDSWAKVRALDETWITQGKMILSTIFELAPEAKKLYSFEDQTGEEYEKSVEKHVQKLMGGMDKGITQWGTPEGQKYLNDLGKRHVNYKVVMDHYPVVGKAVLINLEKALGAAWTPELAKSWGAFYGSLTKVMTEGVY